MLLLREESRGWGGTALGATPDLARQAGCRLGEPLGPAACSVLSELKTSRRWRGPQGQGTPTPPAPSSLGSWDQFVVSDESLGQGRTSRVDLGPACPAAGLNLGSVLTLETRAYPPDPGHGSEMVGSESGGKSEEGEHPDSQWGFLHPNVGQLCQARRGGAGGECPLGRQVGGLQDCEWAVRRAWTPRVAATCDPGS